jgi:hypothetical protein
MPSLRPSTVDDMARRRDLPFIRLGRHRGSWVRRAQRFSGALTRRERQLAELFSLRSCAL